MTKKINKDLTAEQKLILFEDGTEAPGTSELNHEKREGMGFLLGKMNLYCLLKIYKIDANNQCK